MNKGQTIGFRISKFLFHFDSSQHGIVKSLISVKGKSIIMYKIFWKIFFSEYFLKFKINMLNIVKFDLDSIKLII